MARRMMIMALLLIAIVFSVATETWYVEPASLSYNKFQGTSATATVRLRVSRNDSSGVAKNFYLLVTGANLGSYETGARRLYLNNNLASEYVSVNLRKTSGLTEISTPNTAGGKTLLTGSIASSASSADVSFKVYIPTDYILTAGTYTNFFTFSLYVGTSAYSSSLPASAAGIFSAEIVVTSSGYRGSVSIYPTLVNFGSMQEGLSYTGTVNMLVTGVSNFAVYVSSANLGKMRQADSTSEIAYGLVVDSSATSPVTISSFPFTDPIVSLSGSTTNRLYTIVITTDTLDFVDAGDYTDTLTFSFIQP